MTDKVIFTPYFLDKAYDDLDHLVQGNWVVNRPDLPAGEQQTRMAALYEPLAEAVETAVLEGDRPVSVAGDCCASLAMFAGLQRAGVKPKLIWFDAHGDFNTWETTPSGFLGGMPLAWLVGLGEQTMMDSLGIETLPEQDVTLTDGRDLDPLEAESVASSMLSHLQQVTDLSSAPLPRGPLWVHFDVDVLNLEDAPAVSYPAEGGPSAQILGEVFRALAISRQVKAVSVSLWNPQLDSDGQTEKVVLDLLRQLLA